MSILKDKKVEDMSFSMVLDTYLNLREELNFSYKRNIVMGMELNKKITPDLEILREEMDRRIDGSK